MPAKLVGGVWVPDFSVTPTSFSLGTTPAKAQAIITASGGTVNGLLALANLALSGSALSNGLTVSDVNYAVDAINRGFDQRRFVVPCN